MENKYYTGTFDNGKIAFKYSILNKMWHGISETYNYNGTKLAIRNYIKHQMHGSKIEFKY